MPTTVSYAKDDHVGESTKAVSTKQEQKRQKGSLANKLVSEQKKVGEGWMEPDRHSAQKVQRLF